jgi:hypothetical protein
VYGTFFSDGSFGSAVSIAFSTNSENGAAALYSARWYVDVRVPGGTDAQPSSLPTISMYCFDVAHAMNLRAASCCFDVFGTASAHAHSQCEPFGVTATGAAAKPILSATCDCCLL